MKTAGIVCDDYKVLYFKEQLAKADYLKIVDTSPFKSGTTLIRVEFEDKELVRVTKLIKLLNSNVSRSN